jgi:hypothetical protein
MYRSNAGIVASNLARDMDVFARFTVLCRTVYVYALRLADLPSKESDQNI